jgi:hypothetical protein
VGAHAVYPQPGSSAQNINRLEYKSAVPKRRTCIRAGSNRESQSPDFGPNLKQLPDHACQTKLAPSLPHHARKLLHLQSSKASLRQVPNFALTFEARKPNLKSGFISAEAAIFFGESSIMLSNSFRLGDESNSV